jgi:hypothetical protein
MLYEKDALLYFWLYVYDKIILTFSMIGERTSDTDTNLNFQTKIKIIFFVIDI